MKGLAAAGAVLPVWLALAGCEPVRSLHPFHTEEAVTAAPDWLLGTWVEDDRRLLVFTEDSIVLSDADNPNSVRFEFEAVHFTAGGDLFVDVTLKSVWGRNTSSTSAEPESMTTRFSLDEGSGLKLFLVPTHMLLRPRRTGRRGLELSYLADDELLETLGMEALELANDVPAIVTAAPPEQWMRALESGRIPTDSFETYGEFHLR